MDDLPAGEWVLRLVGRKGLIEHHRVTTLRDALVDVGTLTAPKQFKVTLPCKLPPIAKKDTGSDPENHEVRGHGVWIRIIV